MVSTCIRLLEIGRIFVFSTVVQSLFVALERVLIRGHCVTALSISYSRSRGKSNRSWIGPICFTEGLNALKGLAYRLAKLLFSLRLGPSRDHRHWQVGSPPSFVFDVVCIVEDVVADVQITDEACFIAVSDAG